MATGSPAKRLTDLTIERTRPPQTGRLELWDAMEPGVGVRVGRRDKTFILKMRFAGAQQWLTLGKYPGMSIAEAREKARECKLLAQQGTDPRRHEQLAAKARERERINTVAHVVEEYIQRHAMPNQRSWRDTRRRLKRDLVQLYGDRPIMEIDRADIIRMLDQVRDRGVGIGANRLLAHTKRFFGWCVERGLIEASPADNVRKPVKEVSRDRVLTDDELLAVWDAAEGLGYPYGHATQLLVLLGQRRDEVSRMRWDHLNLKARTWTLPAEENKGNRVHVVPLPDTAVEILQDLPRHESFVFWALRPDTAINGWGKIKRRLDEGSEVQDWRIHDIRRSVASGLARMAFEPHIVERVLNHATTAAGPLARVYQRYDFEKEKRLALEAWARHLAGLQNPIAGDVVPLLRR